MDVSKQRRSSTPGLGSPQTKSPLSKVDGEKWRRPTVTFPDEIKSHTRQQVSCCGPDGLLRHYFTIDVIGRGAQPALRQ
jgi:hypothetical protein